MQIKYRPHFVFIDIVDHLYTHFSLRMPLKIIATNVGEVGSNGTNVPVIRRCAA